jgi:hypothetical protein
MRSAQRGRGRAIGAGKVGGQGELVFFFCLAHASFFEGSVGEGTYM